MPRTDATRDNARVATSGYSGTPLTKKLGMRDGDRVALVGAPAGFEALSGAMPRTWRASRAGSVPRST